MKKILVIILSLTMLLSLAACGGGKEEHKHTSVKVAAKAATCTEAGNNEYWTCSDCNKVYADEACTTETTVEAQTIAAKGHTWTNADCDTPKTCSVCSATEGEANGHTWTNANCETPKTCSVCSATEGEALGHEWSGACDTSCNRDGCDETRTASSHLDSNEDDVCDNCDESVSSQISGGGSSEGTGLPKDEFNN